MPGLSVRVEGSAELAGRLHKAAEDLGSAPLDKAVLRAAGLIRAEAQRSVTAGGASGLRVRTGRLRGAMHEFLTGPGRAVIGVPVEYGPALEYGARPHFIMAKKPGGVLRFVGEGGKVLFRHIVFHPGNRPYRFMAGALEKARPAAENEIRKVYAGPLRLEVNRG